ncbi:MAG: TetR/AcrR family transcriptional regulator [Desertimonas sp.]
MGVGAPRSSDTLLAAPAAVEPPGEAAPGRRERKRRSTRTAIVEAALELFEQQGYSETSIEEITERADVARRTFFRHFVSKDAVLLPDFDDYLVAVAQRVGCTPRPLTVRRLLEAYADAAPLLDAKVSVLQRARSIMARNEVDVSRSAWRLMDSVRAMVIGMIAEAAGLPPDDDRVVMATSLTLHVLEAGVTTWITSSPTEPAAEVFQRALDMTIGLVDETITLA